MWFSYVHVFHFSLFLRLGYTWKMCTTFGCDRGAARPGHKQAGKNGGLSEALEIRQADSNVVGIICLLVEIGLTDLPKTEGPVPPCPSRSYGLGLEYRRRGETTNFPLSTSVGKFATTTLHCTATRVRTTRTLLAKEVLEIEWKRWKCSRRSFFQWTTKLGLFVPFWVWGWLNRVDKK